MTLSRILLVTLLLTLPFANAMASGTIGIYAIMDKVVLEPSDTTPERIQIWGAFALQTTQFSLTTLGDVTSTSGAQRGYLYFHLPANAGPAIKEWMDLKAMAGTGQAIAFGNFDATSGVRIRPASEKPTGPEAYVTNVGIVRLGGRSEPPVVKELRSVR